MVSTNAVIYSNAYELKILVEISIFDNRQLNIWVFSCNRYVYAVWHDAVRWIGRHIKKYKRPTVLICTGQMWYFKRLLWFIQWIKFKYPDHFSLKLWYYWIINTYVVRFVFCESIRCYYLRLDDIIVTINFVTHFTVLEMSKIQSVRKFFFILILICFS